MRRFILTMICVFCLIGTAKAKTFEEMIPLMRQSSIKVSEVWDMKNQKTGEKEVVVRDVCTGVLYKTTPQKSIIVTASHCVSVFPLKAEGINVVKSYKSAHNDIAVLITEKPLTNKIPTVVTKTAPKKDDGVYVFGYPGGKEYYGYGKFLKEHSTAVIEMYPRVAITYGDLLVVAVPIFPGCSGGGLFNSEGELIGINVITYGPESKSVPIYYLKSIFRALAEEEEDNLEQRVPAK